MKSEAVTELRRLAHGLQTDEAGARRLLERIASAEQPELLRDVLVELGAAALLDSVGTSR